MQESVMLGTLDRPEVQDTTLNLRVLIVEDHPDVARMFAVLLREHGCQVQQSHSGLSAITMAPLFLPEVLLLDLNLPGLDGFEVARHLRDEMGPLRPYIIAITAFTQDRFREKANDAGVDLFLTKPVSSRELINHLLEWRDG
jgi:two-component system CheB/CheR fusion protein